MTASKIIEKSIFDLPCLLSSKVIGISIDFKFVFIKIDVISIWKEYPSEVMLLYGIKLSDFSE